LKDVSFQVERGEVVGIIGRNGAGKSTLLKVLSRITEPTEGRAVINGRVGSLLEVGTGFHQELTGRENIYLNGAILGMTKDEIDRKFDEIVDFSGVEKFIDTPVKRYSSGMRVRLAFSVAAHLDPEILLIDEVLAVGDAAFQKKCLGKMGDVAKSGRTVLFVSHNMGSIQKLCPRSLLLNNGQIVLDSNTQEVVETYLSNLEKTIRDTSLDAVPRRNGLGECIRFTDCSIVNSEGEIDDHLLFGESFGIYLEARASVELRDLSIIVGIDSFKGNRITTATSEDNNILFKASPLQPLRVYVRFDDLVLKPGVYLLTFGIRSGRRGLDHIRRVLRLRITDVLTGEIKSYSDLPGFVHTVGQWKRFTSKPDLESKE
jgi:lipopolysaccharide transport system ATP-binding protein